MRLAHNVPTDGVPQRRDLARGIEAAVRRYIPPKLSARRLTHAVINMMSHAGSPARSYLLVFVPPHATF